MLGEYVELRRYGYLYRSFVSRDIAARYKGSVLGIAWSLLNPLAMMLIYTLVFSTIVKINIDDFPAFFITGFLPWYFFSTALAMGTPTLVSHASLIQKIYFPREVLPLSMTTANLVNMLLAFAVFIPYAFYERGWSPVGLITLVPVTLAFFVFTAALTTLLAAFMVFVRDTEFLLGVVLTAWFYLTPIVYSFDLIQGEPTLLRILEKNPLVPFIDAYRSVLFDLEPVSLRDLAIIFAIAAGTWLVCYAGFNRMEHRIAEEL